MRAIVLDRFRSLDSPGDGTISGRSAAGAVRESGRYVGAIRRAAGRFVFAECARTHLCYHEVVELQSSARARRIGVTLWNSNTCLPSIANPTISSRHPLAARLHYQ